MNNLSNKNFIYNFEQILLQDAVIKESWELNDKTYGIITGKLLGKVKNEVKRPDHSNPQEPPKLPQIIPNPIKSQKKIRNFSGESNVNLKISFF